MVNFFLKIHTEELPPVVKSTKAKSKSIPNSSTPARSAKAQEAAKAREEARRKMMEDRRKLSKAKKIDEWGRFFQHLLFSAICLLIIQFVSSGNRKFRSIGFLF